MTCHICENIDPTLPNTVNAEALGTSEASIRRHKAANHLGLEEVDEFFTDLPKSLITSRGRSIRTENGWEKVSFDYRRAALIDALSYDDVERAIVDYRPQPYQATFSTNETLVVCAADYQVGKQGSGGGTQELINRVMHAYSCIAQDAALKRYQEIIFADLGDSTEGFGNTKQQAQTNDLSLTDQIRVANRLLIEGIKMLAPHTPKLTYTAVSSNHCQVRDGIGAKAKTNFAGDDYGLLIQDHIMEVLADRPEFAHVSATKPNKHEEAMTHETRDGTVIGFTHGHLSNKQENVKDWFKGQSHGRRSNLHNADMLVFGHFHSPYLGSSGDSRLVIGAPTMDNGSDWFSNTTGEAHKPGMLTFQVNKGDMSGWKIYRGE